MANYKNADSQKRTKTRRVILFVALIAVMLIAIWRVMGPPVGAGKTEGQASLNPADPLVQTTSAGEVEQGNIPEAIRSAPQGPEQPVKVEAEVENGAIPLVNPLPNPGQALFEAGQAAMAKKDYITGREKLSQAVAAGLEPNQENQARQLLNQAADEWLFSSVILDNDQVCQRYRIAQGDTLASIGKKFNLPYQLLQKINKIASPTSLRVGEVIKVVTGPVRIKVQKQRYQMSVYLQDILVRSYPVGLGKPGRGTPTGLWLVKLKQMDPSWHDKENGKFYKPEDPENPLGERWIGLEGREGDAKGREGFGIHGTIKPEEIGQSASRGCIRLLNKNVEELYDLVVEDKTLVETVD